MSDHTRIDITVSPLTERMVGVARHGMTPFDVPYVSHIVDNLFQGGCFNGAQLPLFIDHVVSLYPWESYAIDSGKTLKTYLEVEMYDAKDQGFDQVEWISDHVVRCLETGPTLVHCQAGLNRSSLVAARAIMKKMGLTGEQAIALLREKRSPAVLCNRAFEEYILS